MVEESAYPRQSLFAASELAEYPQSSYEKSIGLANSQCHLPWMCHKGALTSVDRKVHQIDAEHCQGYREHAPLPIELSVRRSTIETCAHVPGPTRG